MNRAKGVPPRFRPAARPAFRSGTRKRRSLAEKQDSIGPEDLRKDWERRGRPRTALGLLFEIAEWSRKHPNWAAINQKLIEDGFSVSQWLEGEKWEQKAFLGAVTSLRFSETVTQEMRRVARELTEVTSAALQKQIDLLRPVAEGAAAIEMLARQPLMVSNPGDWAGLKKIASQKGRAEVKKILTKRAKDIERYWLACLGLAPGRRGRHRVPIGKTQPYKCALLVKSCLPRLKQVYEEKRRIKRANAKAIKRNPLTLRRKLTEAGCSQEEVDLAVKYNTPLRAALELVARNVHLSEDTVARYYRTHRKNLGPSVAGAQVLEPEGSR